MSENPPSGPMHGHGTSGFPSAPTGFPSGPPAWQPAPSKGQSRGLTYVALAIAVIATALAIVGWFRPAPPPPAPHASSPTYTEQQIADAKSAACSAYDTVKRGTTLQTNLPQTDDPAMANAQATHAQLSLIAGSWYLREQLNSATPQPLAGDINKLADTLLQVGVNAIAGAKNADPSQSSRMDDANSAFERVAESCK
jgi:hypothetical protein